MSGVFPVPLVSHGVVGEWFLSLLMIQTASRHDLRIVVEQCWAELCLERQHPRAMQLLQGGSGTSEAFSLMLQEQNLCPKS